MNPHLVLVTVSIRMAWYTIALPSLPAISNLQSDAPQFAQSISDGPKEAVKWRKGIHDMQEKNKMYAPRHSNCFGPSNRKMLAGDPFLIAKLEESNVPEPLNSGTSEVFKYYQGSSISQKHTKFRVPPSSHNSEASQDSRPLKEAPFQVQSGEPNSIINAALGLFPCMAAMVLAVFRKHWAMNKWW